MLSLQWFRHWDKIFWVMFTLMSAAILIGGARAYISFEYVMILGFFMVIIGAGKLGNEVRNQRMANYQDDIYRKLHQISQHIESTFNATDSFKTKTEFRLNKMDTRRKDIEYGLENNYRHVTRKVLELENKLNKIAKLIIEKEKSNAIKTEKTFTEKVLSIVKKIPRGKVTTYSEIARAVGNPKASKATGRILSNHAHLKSVPVHRVVKSDGKIEGKRGDVRKRTSLLKKEGVKMTKNKVDMDTHMFSFLPKF